MNLNRSEAVELAKAIRDYPRKEDQKIMIAPPFPYLEAVAGVVKGSGIILGAQNLCHELSGAFTGEVSALMLKDLSVDTVIIGHSERRHVFGESDAYIAKKIETALSAGLNIIFCIGETLSEREKGEAEKVVLKQLSEGLKQVKPETLPKVTIAYEPVWAIGTGRTATPEDAEAIHAIIRNKLGELYSISAAEETIIQYGGSVKPDNIKGLMAKPNIDGALVGGAALKADSFCSILSC